MVNIAAIKSMEEKMIRISNYKYFCSLCWCKSSSNDSHNNCLRIL